MNRYVAFLRGIGPSNPNMRNENLRAVGESLGFQHVQTFISSGNLIFDSESDDAAELEGMLEAEWPRQLDFESRTLIRSQSELERLVDLAPFGERTHGPDTYLLVTFSKTPLEIAFELPYQPPGRDLWAVGSTEREIFTVTDTTSAATPDVMVWLEKEFGKDISSRTWLTVQRILKRMTHS